MSCIRYQIYIYMSGKLHLSSTQIFVLHTIYFLNYIAFVITVLLLCVQYEQTDLISAPKNLWNKQSWGTAVVIMYVDTNHRYVNSMHNGPLARYVKLPVAHVPGMLGMFPRHRFQRKPLVSDPVMNHGTCVTRVPWCMSGSPTCSGGENVPGIPGACTTRNFAYLARSPLIRTTSSFQNPHTPQPTTDPYPPTKQSKSAHKTKTLNKAQTKKQQQQQQHKQKQRQKDNNETNE